jgi:hypothetical protein
VAEQVTTDSRPDRPRRRRRREQPVGRHGEVGGITLVRQDRGAGGGRDLREGLHVVPVAVRLRDPDERAVADQLEQPGASPAASTRRVSPVAVHRSR